MDDVGLVLSGGGGKGAYQIGVWKALREFNVDKHITAVSGTSVGALNAALYLNDDIELAEKIWRDLTTDKILTPKSSLGSLLDVGSLKLTISSLLDTSVVNAAIIAALIINKSGEGIWSRQGLEEIIDRYVDLNKVSTSPIKIYTACTSLPFLDTEYFLLNSLPSEQIKKILIASSALPIIFPNQEINNTLYIDGGVTDNSPVKTLYDEGYRNFIIIYLSREKRVDRSLYKDANIIEILPQNDLGNVITGTLDFTPEGANRRIDFGYNDAYNILKNVYEYFDTRNQKSIEYIKYSDETDEFINLHADSLERRNDLKKQICNIKI